MEICLKEYLNKDKKVEWDELIGMAERVVLLGHVSPDGDALGSTLGMASYLKHIGKNTHIIVPNLPPDTLKWLPGAEEIIIDEFQPEKSEKYLEKADVVMLLDFNDPLRLDNLGERVIAARKPWIVIDHHLRARADGVDLLISDPCASSTCEMVFSLLWQLGVWEEMSKECAEALYCGMMTDTGAFTYNSNSPELFFIISQLLYKHIDKDEIFRKVYYTYSMDCLRLRSYAICNNIHFFEEGKVSVYTLTREELLRYNFKRGDLEGLVNMPLHVKDTVLSISLREDLEQDVVRVSLRSIGDVPCNLISERFFNGGGHANASGGKLYGMTCEQALEVAKEAIAYFRDYI